MTLDPRPAVRAALVVAGPSLALATLGWLTYRERDQMTPVNTTGAVTPAPMPPERPTMDELQREAEVWSEDPRTTELRAEMDQFTAERSTFDQRLADVRAEYAKAYESWSRQREQALAERDAAQAERERVLRVTDGVVADVMAERDALADDVARLEQAWEQERCGLQVAPGEHCDYQRLRGLPRCDFHMPAYLDELTAERDAAQVELRQADEFGRGEFRVTTWAYDQAWRVINEARAERDAARAELASLRERVPADRDGMEESARGYFGRDYVPADQVADQPAAGACVAFRAGWQRAVRHVRAAVQGDQPGTEPGPVVICGSVTTSADAIEQAAGHYTERYPDRQVIWPQLSDRPPAELNAEWMGHIEQASLVVIVPKPDGTVGEQTAAELHHAVACGRRIVA